MKIIMNFASAQILAKSDGFFISYSNSNNNLSIFICFILRIVYKCINTEYLVSDFFFN